MDMKKLLFEASLQGSVSSLLGLLREDPLILDRYTILNPYNETPLHVASMLGHLDLVRQILKRKPELAMEMNSRRSSPLHLASAKGYVEIVKELVLVSPDTCLACDRDGMNPVHLAAMKGKIDVLNELLRVRAHAARAMANRGETILHLCVKHNQFEALKLLVATLSDHEFINSRDDDGHTILHIAVADKQIETVKFLLQNTSIEVNEPNGDGVTAMGILARSQRDVNDKEIKKSLINAGAIEENRNNSEQQAQNHTETLLTLLEETPPSEKKIVPKTNQEKWLEDNRNTLMVVASLIATMAFQVGVNPPGGVWQEFESDPNRNNSASFPSDIPRNYRHIPGTSIMADLNKGPYRRFTIANMISLISSLSIILLLISGLPIKRRVFMIILMVTMWIAVNATAFTFLISVVTLEPYKRLTDEIAYVVMIVLLVWMGLMSTLILAHIIRIIIKCLRKLINYHSQRRGRQSRFTTSHDGV